MGCQQCLEEERRLEVLLKGEEIVGYELNHIQRKSNAKGVFPRDFASSLDSPVMGEAERILEMIVTAMLLRLVVLRAENFRSAVMEN